MDMERVSSVRIFGPFQPISRFTGLDLTYSLFKFQECRANRTLLPAILSTISFLIIISLFIFKIICISFWEGKDLSFGWADSYVDLGVFLYGLGSVFSLAVWTHYRFMKTFQSRLDNTEESPSRSIGSFTKFHIKAFVLSGFTIAFLVTHSFLREIYGGVRNPSGDFLPRVDNLLYYDIIVRTLSAVFSCLASSIYMITLCSLGRKMKIFNEDIKQIIEKEGLQKFETILKVSDRHSELLTLVKFARPYINCLTTLGFLGSFFVHVSALFIFVQYRSQVPVPYIVAMYIYGILSAISLPVCLITPANLQVKIAETIDIILYDRTIWQSSDERVVNIAKSMIKRAESEKIRMVLFQGCFVVDERLPHKLMLLIPIVSGMLALLTSLFNPLQQL